jgi:hypothetical protein
MRVAQSGRCLRIRTTTSAEAFGSQYAARASAGWRRLLGPGRARWCGLGWWAPDLGPASENVSGPAWHEAVAITRRDLAADSSAWLTSYRNLFNSYN